MCTSDGEHLQVERQATAGCKRDSLSLRWRRIAGGGGGGGGEANDNQGQIPPLAPCRTAVACSETGGGMWGIGAFEWGLTDLPTKPGGCTSAQVARPRPFHLPTTPGISPAVPRQADHTCTELGQNGCAVASQQIARPSPRLSIYLPSPCRHSDCHPGPDFGGFGPGPGSQIQNSELPMTAKL